MAKDKSNKDAKGKDAKPAGKPSQDAKPAAKESKAKRPTKADKDSVEKQAAPTQPARLQVHYNDTIVPALMKQFGYQTKMQAPRITKITLNMGVGEAVADKKIMENAAADMLPGQVILLENVRFHPEEEADDMDFAKKLGSLAEIFVQDGFGVVHRKHATTDAITRVLPSVAGLLLENEVTTIMNAMQKPKLPLMAIVGGAKIADKIDIIKTFIHMADMVAIGGAIGKPVRFEEITDGQAYARTIEWAGKGAYADALVDIWRAVRESRLDTVTDGVRQITGREPIPFDQWAAENASSFQ